ncbi:hypothetical protein [Xylophilus sp. GOD-11R]|uniref:hypothetical protein n=1 Tax=Xylophilus sp. GOD-11R TaxID=3089814 RepID=UPI00298D2D33|nr:hypothetical protein [Xylophilus sp. GOD-11R]WPB55097.1 hypothetical protein R9X41_13085 [Xylophilus sp. GOD-11R]
MKFTRFLAGLGLAAVLAGCGHTNFPEIPTGLRPRAEPIQPEEAARLTAEIEAERARLLAEQTVQEAACYQNFIVNSCLLEVRGRYRPMLNALNRRDVDVRAGEREREERVRLARVEDQRRQSEADHARAAERAASAVPLEQRQADLDRRNADRAASRPADAARAQANRNSTLEAHDKAVAEQAQRAANAPAERARYEARQKEAAERKAALARRQADRATKPPVEPLPATPGPASPPVQTPTRP